MPPTPKHYNINIDNTLNKNYSYELDGLTLKFTLNVDDSKSLSGYKMLLEKAINDIDQDLNLKEEESK